MSGPGASRSIRCEGWCRHQRYSRGRRYGPNKSRRRSASAAAPPELAKHLAGIEYDIADHSAAVSPSEKGDSINGGTNDAKRRRRSGRSWIRRRVSK